MIKPHQIVMCNIPDITCNCSILLGNLRKHSLNTTNNMCKTLTFCNISAHIIQHLKINKLISHLHLMLLLYLPAGVGVIRKKLLN